MTKIIFTLLRYAITSAGVSEAVATDDSLMRIASAIVAIVTTVIGLYESYKHNKLKTASNQDSNDKGPSDGNVIASNVALLALAVMLLPFVSGCTTTATSGTTTVTMQKATRQGYGSSGSVSATVVTTRAGASTSSLGEVVWGLDGSNYTTPLVGVSTSEVVTLTTPSTLAAGSYIVTANVGSATARTTLKVIDYPSEFNAICTTLSSGVKLSFKLSTYYILKNNPDLSSTLSITADSVKVILCASSPTEEGYKAALILVYPNMDDASLELAASALKTAYDVAASTWKAETGTTLSLQSIWSDSRYASGVNTLVTAACDGVAAGVALYNSGE